MALKLKESGGSFPIVSDGPHMARLVSIIDLGVQSQPDYNGEKRNPVQKIQLTFEVVDELLSDGSVPLVFETVTNSSHEKSTLVKVLNALGLKDLGANFDIGQALGRPVQLNIEHRTTQKGRTFPKITAYMPARANADVAEAKTDLALFDYDEPDLALLGSMPVFMIEKLKSALNFSGSAVQKALDATGASTVSSDSRVL